MKYKVVRIDYVEHCRECPYCDDLMTGVGCSHPDRGGRSWDENNKIGNYPPEDEFPEFCPLVLQEEEV